MNFGVLNMALARATNARATQEIARRLAQRLLDGCTAKEAQAVYREANAAGVGDLVRRKVAMGRADA